MEIMEGFFGGDLLRVVEKHNKSGNVRDLALDYLLYGFMAELFGRANGFTRGLGNSMHVFFLPFGIYPNNAIVGGSGTISTGAALFKKVNNKKGIVVCNVGDAAMARGPVWEALNFSAMDQYKTLWESHNDGMPILYNIFNNSYGMGDQTRGETMGQDRMSRIASGVSPTQFHAETVDGYNPLAVIDAMERKLELLRLMVDEPHIEPAHLADLHMPVLVIAGTDDMIEPAHTRLIAESIPGARLALIEGTHFVAAESPDAFNCVVGDFLALPFGPERAYAAN
jgi:2-oxoisovalerate dehydrogenase E1 component